MMKLKLKPIHLFIILLGSLLLCGVLGVVCSTKEGMATGSYVGSAGDTVVVEAPPCKESELDSMRSTTSDETNDGETRFGSLLTSIGNDFDSETHRCARTDNARAMGSSAWKVVQRGNKEEIL